MDIVINLLLFYSKTLVVLLMFQQVSNQPIKPLWNIIGPFLYVLLLIICPPVGYFAFFFIFKLSSALQHTEVVLVCPSQSVICLKKHTIEF